MQNLFIILFFTAASVANAGEYFTQEHVTLQLNKFADDSKNFMHEMPLKQYYPTHKWFNQIGPAEKINWRGQFLESGNVTKGINSNPYTNDRAVDLVDNTDAMVSNLNSIEELNLTTGQVENAPWSDDYWPIYKGLLGSRYTKEEFIYLDGWQESFDYITAKPFYHIFKENPEDIDNLSPSEKYDLLIGSTEGVLTKAMWAQGKGYMDRYGDVETWMGICHGWAPASYMLVRPKSAIEVMSFDGKTKIKFYPSDIKALSSLLWAQTRVPTKFVGGRCHSKDPEEDEIGRLTEKDCLDTNPATWHLSVVNQIGKNQRSFVLDATYDYEVWNQPIVAYSYKYFNPITLDSAATLEEATVLLADHKEDKFKKHRSTEAKSIVGIAMELIYSVETAPNHAPFNSPNHDRHNRVLYLYDLELDEANKIIGGEWYQNAHPDFLWTPVKDGRAMTMSDYYIMNDPKWNGESALSAKWQQLATMSAKHGNSPLAMIVESLVELSQKQPILENNEIREENDESN